MKNIMKKVCLVLMVTIFSFGFSIVGVTPAKASDSLNLQEKQRVVNTPIYYVIGEINEDTPDNIPTYGCINKTSEELVAMNNEDFKSAIKSELKWAINQKNAGASIFWHPEALDISKIVVPELHAEISDQLKKQTSVQSIGNQSNANTKESYTPGSTNKTYYLDNKTAGLVFWRFNKRATWEWDANGITSLTTSCWASKIWPGWTYTGVIDEYSAWISNPTSKYTYSQGEFTTNVQNSYPYIRINCYAGGTSNVSGGFE